MACRGITRCRAPVNIVDQTLVMLRTILNDADVYSWDYAQLQRHVNGVFSKQRVHELAHGIIKHCVKQTNSAIVQIKQTANRP